MSATILVVGFGAFSTIQDNPASRLANAVDGQRGGLVVGREIPVSYTRGVAETLALADTHGPAVVLGVGVAVLRTAAMLERGGHHRRGDELADTDGVSGGLSPGPTWVASTLDVPRWARALGCAVSEDAGSYVCNGWLHQVTQALDVPVGFLHIPRSGLAPARLLRALDTLMSPGAPRVG